MIEALVALVRWKCNYSQFGTHLLLGASFILINGLVFRKCCFSFFKTSTHSAFTGNRCSTHSLRICQTKAVTLSATVLYCAQSTLPKGGTVLLFLFPPSK